MQCTLKVRLALPFNVHYTTVTLQRGGEMANRTQKIFLARKSERAAYRGVYGLYGYVDVGGTRCAIEDLSGAGAEDDPKYEVMAPDGFHFDSEGLHSLLCVSLTDLRDRIRGERLVSCGEHCGPSALVSTSSLGD